MEFFCIRAPQIKPDENPLIPASFVVFFCLKNYEKGFWLRTTNRRVYVFTTKGDLRCKRYYVNNRRCQEQNQMNMVKY